MFHELQELADALNEENPGQPELEREEKTVGDLMREAEERAERMKAIWKEQNS